MAIDLEAIKKKIESLNSIRQSKVQFWKPVPGEHVIRIIPFPDTPDDDPFKHLKFYYLEEGKSGILAPSQFDEEDPVANLAQKLWSGTSEDKQLARKLSPNMRHYACIVDRKDEDMGPQLWSFGKQLYIRLLGFFADAEIQDYIDPQNGFDLKVSIIKEPKKKFLTTTVDVARSRSPLSKDKKKVKEWIENCINPREAYSLKTTEQIEKIITDWLQGPDAEEDVGTSRGEETESLDSAIESLKSSGKEKSPRSPRKNVEADTTVETASSDIDDVFNQVLNS
jgi:hypothetical protein